MALSAKTGLFVAREVVKGTPETSASAGIPTKMSFEEKPKRDYPDEDRAVRSKNTTVVPGTTIVDWDAKGPWYNDSCGYFLTGFFGLPATSSVSGANQNVFTALDVPEALTLWKYIHTDTVILPYSCVSEVKVMWEAATKELNFESKGISQKATFGQSRPSQTFDTGKPFSGWLPTVKLGGIAATDVEKVEILVKAPVEELYTSGSQYYTRVDYGKLEVTGKMTLDFDSEASLTSFKNMVDASLEFTAQGYAIGSGAYNTLDILVPVATYNTWKLDYGKAAIKVEVDFVARYDPVSGHDCQYTLTNLTAGYVN